MYEKLLYIVNKNIASTPISNIHRNNQGIWEKISIAIWCDLHLSGQVLIYSISLHIYINQGKTKQNKTHEWHVTVSSINLYAKDKNLFLKTKIKKWSFNFSLKTQFVLLRLERSQGILLVNGTVIRLCLISHRKLTISLVPSFVPKVYLEMWHESVWKVEMKIIESSFFHFSVKYKRAISRNVTPRFWQKYVSLSIASRNFYYKYTYQIYTYFNKNVLCGGSIQHFSSQKLF